METMTQFVNRNRIRINSEWADTNPLNPDWTEANHYKCVFRHGNRQMTVYFSKGYGLTGDPDAKEVLGCLAYDSASVENAQSFEDWAAELGYDEDSRKAERIFRGCERQAEKLKTFLGDELYETLLWETERE